MPNAISEIASRRRESEWTISTEQILTARITSTDRQIGGNLLNLLLHRIFDQGGPHAAVPIKIHSIFLLKMFRSHDRIGVARGWKEKQSHGMKSTLLHFLQYSTHSYQ
jgi:hypothetical protein